jgi:hypothetical protein
MLGVHGAEGIISLVCSIVFGILEGRVGAGTPCIAYGDCAGVVLGSMVLGTDGTFGLVYFA